MRNSRQPIRTARASRRGSLIIEAVIAALLLATATYALTRLARSAAVLSQQGDQHLSAILAAENTIERLRGLSVDQLVDQADAVARSVREASGCEVKVSTQPMGDSGRLGLHIRVDVSATQGRRVTLHDWRLRASQDSATADTVPVDQQEGGDA